MHIYRLLIIMFLVQENDLDIAGGSSSGYPEVEESLTEKVFLNDTVSQSNAKTKKNRKKKGKEDKILNKKNIESASYKMSNMSMFGEESSSPRYGLSGAITKNETSGALSSSVLQVEPKMLNAETELRRIFGSKVVNSLGRSHQAGPSRQNRGARRGNHNHRKTILVSPLEHWPRWDGSFSMEYLETKDHYHYFRFAYLNFLSTVNLSIYFFFLIWLVSLICGVLSNATSCLQNH